MRQLAKEIVDSVSPHGGWWNDNTEEVLEEAAETMLESMDQDAVEEVLSDVIAAIRGEYGD